MADSSLIRKKRKLAKMTTLCHSFPFVAIHCHSLSLAASLFVIGCTSRYRFLSLAVPFVVTRWHSSLICLLVNDL